MNVVFYYRMYFDNFSNEVMSEKYTIPGNEYKKFLKGKKHHKEEYEEIIFDDEEEEELDDDSKIELYSLNYNIIEETVPEWCNKIKQDLVDEANNCAMDNDFIPELDLENLIIKGCKLIETPTAEVCLTYRIKDDDKQYKCIKELSPSEHQKYLEACDDFFMCKTFDKLEEILPTWCKKAIKEIVDSENSKQNDKKYKPSNINIESFDISDDSDYDYEDDEYLYQ